MPDFWRTELWHPVTVHFPIALLSVATFFLLISFFLQTNNKIIVEKMSLLLLVMGTIGAWVALFTGDIADGVVSRKICDPTVLKDHELAAETMTYIFTVASLLSVIFFFRLLSSKILPFFPYLILILMIVGSFFLFRAGHLGAAVAYHQGGGVYKHVVDCDEFQ